MTAPTRATCPACQRALLPGATSCPFCEPQRFEAIEATVQAPHAGTGEFVGLEGVPAAAQAAQRLGAAGFLHVYLGSNRGQTVLLGARPVTIGRRRDLNILALDDAGASSRHCEVRPDPATGGWTVVDLGSRNGTYVHDIRVTEKPLVTGDVIAIGGTRIYVGLL